METIFNSWASALFGSGIVGFLVKLFFDRYLKWLEKIDSKFESISESQTDTYNGIKIIEAHLANMRKSISELEESLDKLNEHEAVLREHAVKIAFLESDYENTHIVN